MFDWIWVGLKELFNGLFKELIRVNKSEPEEIIDWSKIKCIKCMDHKEVVWPLSDGSMLAVPCDCTKGK